MDRSRNKKTGKTDLAVGVLLCHPGWTDQQIAAEVGCNRTSLYRNPTFKRARKALRENGRADMPRGEKADGRLEAWTEEERDTEE